MPTIQTNSPQQTTARSRPQASKNTAKQDTGENNSSKNKKYNDSSSGPGVYQERFLFGLFSDFIKNSGKIMTGSLFTDLLKGILKDKNQTWEQVLYSTLVDAGPSRFFTDYVNALAVRILKFLPPELSSQIFATPTVLFFRAATTSENVNAKSAKGNISPEEAELQKEVLKQPFVKRVHAISRFFKKNIQSKLDFVFEKALGVKAGEDLKDKDGNFIYNEKGKKVKSNPIVNLKHLSAVAAGLVAGTALLPRHTKATGSDAVTTPIRATLNTITTSLFRLNTTLLHNSVGPHISGGANFDKCFNTSVQEKTLVPLTQYASDNIGALLSKHIPLNGAILGIIMRLITEIPSTFLSSGLVNLSKGDRLPEAWKLLGQRVWLPVTSSIRETFKPFYGGLAKHVYSKVLGGVFNPKIKNMYDADIGNSKMIKLDPELDAKYAKGVIPTFTLFVKETFKLFGEVPSILAGSKVDSDFKRNSDRWLQKSVNRRIDFFKKHGFRAPTHETKEAKATLNEEQLKQVNNIEAKELSRGFKMVWDDELNAYKKIAAPLPSIEKDDDEDELELSKTKKEDGDIEEKLTKSQDIEEETSTKQALLQQAA